MLRPARFLNCVVVGLVLVFFQNRFDDATSVAVAQDGKKSKKTLAKRLPRIAPVEPQNAGKTFRLQKGFRLELVASEPMVSDPVDACFDANGRMYVAEMHGYPYSQEPTKLLPKGGGKKNGAGGFTICSVSSSLLVVDIPLLFLVSLSS